MPYYPVEVQEALIRGFKRLAWAITLLGCLINVYLQGLLSLGFHTHMPDPALFGDARLTLIEVAAPVLVICGSSLVAYAWFLGRRASDSDLNVESLRDLLVLALSLMLTGGIGIALSLHGFSDVWHHAWPVGLWRWYELVLCAIGSLLLIWVYFQCIRASAADDLSYMGDWAARGLKLIAVAILVLAAIVSLYCVLVCQARSDAVSSVGVVTGWGLPIRYSLGAGAVAGILLLCLGLRYITRRRANAPWTPQGIPE